MDNEYCDSKSESEQPAVRAVRLGVDRIKSLERKMNVTIPFLPPRVKTLVKLWRMDLDEIVEQLSIVAEPNDTASEPRK